MIRNLCRCGCQALFQLQQVVWGLWKGLLEEGLKQGELTWVDLRGMMQQGKHSLGPLFMEWSVARPKPMLILLLCHPQVRPLCSNTPSPAFLSIFGVCINLSYP